MAIDILGIQVNIMLGQEHLTGGTSSPYKFLAGMNARGSCKW